MTTALKFCKALVDRIDLLADRMLDRHGPLIFFSGFVVLLLAVFYQAVAPGSWLNAVKLSPADVATKQAAVDVASRWLDRATTKRFYVTGLPSVPDQDVVEVFGRAIAMGGSMRGQCHVYVGKGAGEVDLEFALAIVRAGDNGKVCIRQGLSLFDGRTLNQARLEGLEVPDLIVEVGHLHGH